MSRPVSRTSAPARVFWSVPSWGVGGQAWARDDGLFAAESSDLRGPYSHFTERKHRHRLADKKEQETCYNVRLLPLPKKEGWTFVGPVHLVHCLTVWVKRLATTSTKHG